MTDTVGRYAQIATGSNVVENVILMDATFTIDGYTFNALATGQSCQPGAYYNESDGKYYIDSAFSTLVADQAVSDTGTTETSTADSTTTS
jgi:hypothetical protein